MGIEIERKFRVHGDGWKVGQGDGERYVQGYVCMEQGKVVRVRLAPGAATLTIKAPGEGLARLEYEYEIPRAQAQELLDLCQGRIVEKIRRVVFYKGCRWEVDEFLGGNAGLVVAELELENEAQEFERPEWVGEEVTGEQRYLNAALAVHPYRAWGGGEK